MKRRRNVPSCNRLRPGVIYPGMTKQFLVQIDVEKPISSKRLQAAIARVLEWTLDNDIEDAEVLNREIVGQLSVMVVK